MIWWILGNLCEMLLTFRLMMRYVFTNEEKQDSGNIAMALLVSILWPIGMLIALSEVIANRYKRKYGGTTKIR